MIVNDISNLIDTIKESGHPDTEKILKDIQNSLNSFIDYFNVVVKMNIMSHTTEWSSMTEYLFKSADEERRMQHNLAISACCDLNKIASDFGEIPFCPAEYENRKEIASFAGFLATSLYMDEIQEKRDFDELVEYFSTEAPDTRLPHIDINDWDER